MLLILLHCLALRVFVAHMGQPLLLCTLVLLACQFFILQCSVDGRSCESSCEVHNSAQTPWYT